LNQKSRESLELVTKYFNTRWSNISVERYFEYGFELFGKSFTYMKFFDKRLIAYYIGKDKNRKRDIMSNKKSIIKSIKFLKKWLEGKEYKISPFMYYSLCKDGKASVPIRHYIKGDIDNLFLTWLIKEGYLSIEDDERSQIPYIVENYRIYTDLLYEIEPFMNKAMEAIK